jgi:hypothetical protein
MENPPGVGYTSPLELDAELVEEVEEAEGAAAEEPCDRPEVVEEAVGVAEEAAVEAALRMVVAVRSSGPPRYSRQSSIT